MQKMDISFSYTSYDIINYLIDKIEAEKLIRK